MFKLKVIRKFDAAHYLKGYEGKCANLHGHTWKVVFTFAYPFIDGDSLAMKAEVSIGIIQDFVQLKKEIDEILPDHKCLNDLFSFNPTAENLARHFYQVIRLSNSYIHSVEVWESEDSCAEYSEH